MKLVSRRIFIIGLAGLLFSGIAIFLNHQGFAAKLFIISFWILFLGSIIYIFESSKNEK